MSLTLCKADKCNNCLYRALYRAWTLYLMHYGTNMTDTLHIVYVSHTTNILNKYSANTQPSAIHASHVIAKNVLETKIPTKLAIYAKYLMDLHGICIHICATYEVTAINHMTIGTVYMFDIYHLLLGGWVMEKCLWHLRSYWPEGCQVTP